MGRLSLKGLVAGLMLVSLLVPFSAPAGAETLTKFYGGASSLTMDFPDGGGQNDTAAVELPRDDAVSSVYLDVEGRPVLFDNKPGMMDFNGPRGSTAWTGAAAAVPPDQVPTAYESVNGTADQGLSANWDGQYLSASGSGAAAYNLFEFDVSGLSLTNFTLYWKGMGTTQPKMGFSGSNIKLYAYNAATSQWEEFYSMSRPSMIEMDKEVWLNETLSPGDYVDDRGAITMMATVSAAMFATTMDTDYVSLTYAGNATVYPDNVTLDINADGSVEWQNKGKLSGRTSVAGAALAAAVQAALDAASESTVVIPFKFGCRSAGILYLSNLSIIHAPENQAPQHIANSMAIDLDEGENGTGVLDLWDHFTDDGGVANLTFSMEYQSDPTKVKVQINPDGHHIDVLQPTQYWFGTQRYQVRATDRQGLWVLHDSSPIHVRFVNHPPVLEPAGSPVATFGVPFFWTFRASDPDLQYNANESLSISLNSSLLTLDPATGVANFTPLKGDVGEHLLMVTVTDHYGAGASRNLTLRVDNVDSPPNITDNATSFSVGEDSEFTHRFTATDPDLEFGQDALMWSTDSLLFTVGADGTVSWTPDDKDIGTHIFNVSVMDSGGLKDRLQCSITVTAREEPPAISPVASLTVDEDKDVKFKINVSDQDIGDTFTFSSDWPLLSINGTGWASFRADDKDIGVRLVTITVRDRADLTATATVTITVRPVNEPPTGAVISGPASGSKFKQGALVSFSGNASDVDGDALNYTWYSGGEVIGYGKGFSTKALERGMHVITLTVSDGNLSTTSAPVLLEITKKPATAGKGFLPGFEAVAALCAGLLAALALRRRIF